MPSSMARTDRLTISYVTPASYFTRIASLTQRSWRADRGPYIRIKRRLRPNRLSVNLELQHVQVLGQ